MPPKKYIIDGPYYSEAGYSSKATIWKINESEDGIYKRWGTVIRFLLDEELDLKNGLPFL